MANGTGNGTETRVTRTWTDTQQTIAFFIIVATIIIILIWLFRPPTGSEGAMAVLNNLMGALLAAFGMVVNYYFGSSKGSKDKDEAQAKVAEKLAEKVPSANPPVVGTGNGVETVVTTVPAEPATTATITTVTKDDPTKPKKD